MPPYGDYRDICDQPCCTPQLLYGPNDIHTGSALYHRKHATLDQLSGWTSPANVRVLRQRSGSWGYLSVHNNIAFDETGHLWIREDAELRPASKDQNDYEKQHKALVFWTAYNNIGVYLPPKAFTQVQQRTVASLKNQEISSATGVTWTPLAKVTDRVPEGLAGFAY